MVQKIYTEDTFLNHCCKLAMNDKPSSPFFKYTLFLILVFFFEICNTSFAQENPSQISFHKKRVDSIVNLALDHEAILKRYEKAEDLTDQKVFIDVLVHQEKEIKDDSISFELLLEAASFYLENVNYDSAIYFLDQSQNKLKKKSQPTSYANLWQLYGDCYFQKADLVKAQEYYQKVVDLPSENELIQGQIMDAYLDMSKMYSKFGYDSAARRSLVKAIEHNSFDPEQINSRYIFHALGLIHLNQYDYDSAIVYFTKAVSGLDSMRYIDRYGLFYNNTGICLQEQGKLLEADKYYKTALVIRRAREQKTRIASTLTNIATNALLLKEPKRAMDYAIECITISNEIGNPDLLRKGYSLSKEAHMELGMFEEALELQDLEIDLKDSVFNVNQHRQMAQLEAKYEFQNKEAEIKTKNLEIEKVTLTRTFLIIGVALLILIIVLFIRSNNLLKAKSKEIAEKNNLIKEKEALKSRWFVNISHELKTPLTLVAGPIEKVLAEETVNEVGRQDLVLANKNVKHLSKIISEILDISKLEDEKMVLNPKSTDLKFLISSTTSAFDSLAKSTDIKLVIKNEIKRSLEIDEGQFSKALLNLLSNALKYTAKGGEVTVSSKLNESILEISIKDNGMGIAPTDLPHIFNRFYQSDDPMKTRQGGTGIGLSLSKEIVELHGGHILVESEVGKGSIFTICLPANLLKELEPNMKTELVNSEIEEIVPTNQVQIKDSEKQTILLVEDNADMRAFIVSLLKHNYHLIETVNGSDAIEKLGKNIPDLIISDVMMPEMDGIEFVKNVKSKSKWDKIPFIMLTALHTEEDVLYTLRLGVDDYINKPFNADQLKVRIYNLLNNRKIREEEKEGNKTESYDDKILLVLEKEINKHLKDPVLTVPYLADKVAMSERKLQRYLKNQTGFSPIQLIQEIRLRNALTLLEKRKMATVSEVAKEVGITRTSYFTNLFFKRFGKKPEDYLQA